MSSKGRLREARRLASLLAGIEDEQQRVDTAIIAMLVYGEDEVKGFARALRKEAPGLARILQDAIDRALEAF